MDCWRVGRRWGRETGGRDNSVLVAQACSLWPEHSQICWLRSLVQQPQLICPAVTQASQRSPTAAPTDLASLEGHQAGLAVTGCLYVAFHTPAVCGKIGDTAGVDDLRPTCMLGRGVLCSLCWSENMHQLKSHPATHCLLLLLGCVPSRSICAGLQCCWRAPSQRCTWQ